MKNNGFINAIAVNAGKTIVCDFCMSTGSEGFEDQFLLLGNFCEVSFVVYHPNRFNFS